MAEAQEDLVTQLTGRLEQLQQEKAELERSLEGQADGLALKLRLALLAYEQQRPPRRHRRRRSHRSGGSTTVSSPSSSLSTSASTSSSTSFSASPSTQLSPLPQAPLELSPDVLSALRENETLRVRLANSERVNAAYRHELAELRRRVGISIDELEELDLSGNEGVVVTSSGNGAAAARRRQRSISRTEWPSAPALMSGPGSIRIPGASSISPPAARLPTSSFAFSASASGGNGARFQPQSFISDSSSVNTEITTPSSSYPAARAPATTPATTNALSPASVRGTGGGQGRRNSLNALVAAAFAQASPTTQEDPQQGTSRGIDLDDLLHVAAAQSASSSLSSSAIHTASASASASSISSSSSSSALAPGADPLVAAITRSLARLAAAEPEARGARYLRRSSLSSIGREDDAQEEEDGSGSSSTTSRECARELAARRGGNGGGEEGDEEDGGQTPLSLSPGSRSGSLSRRASAS